MPKHLITERHPTKLERLPELPDTLLSTMNEPLNEEQQLYLKNHRHEKRSALARKLGISRLRLNAQLQKLG